MNKPKSVKFSFLVLTLLFILSQTVFAFTANLAGSNGTHTNENGVLAASNESYDSISPEQRTAVLAFKEEQMSSVPETVATLQVPAAAVSDQAITLTANAPAPKPEIKSVVRYVNANSLNVRKEANSDSELVATVKRGDKVTYYETQGEWARIITWSDKKGYILAKYLVNSEKDVEKVAEEEKKPTVSRSTSEKTEASKPASAEALSLTEKIIAYAKSLKGIRYVYGGYSTKGFDCSGFTKYVFAKYDINIPRSSSDYYGFGTKIARSDIRAGDIVLFDIDGGSADVGHVGIYLGDGSFIHASSSKGKIVIANLATYGEKYMGARRVIK